MKFELDYKLCGVQELQMSLYAYTRYFSDILCFFVQYEQNKLWENDAKSEIFDRSLKGQET